MREPVCIWCLLPQSDPIHSSHPFVGPDPTRKP